MRSIPWHFEHGLHSDTYTFNLDPIRVPSKYPGKTHYKGAKHGQPSGNPLGKDLSDFWTIIAQDWEREIWNIPNVKVNHPEKTIHPCHFPIELVQRCVLALTNEHDVVLDPFMGVGLTLIVAIMHNRFGLGFETSQEYIDTAHFFQVPGALRGDRRGHQER
jgi:adenine-specific DNA-methyltransferase